MCVCLFVCGHGCVYACKLVFEFQDFCVFVVGSEAVCVCLWV